MITSELERQSPAKEGSLRARAGKRASHSDPEDLRASRPRVRLADLVARDLMGAHPDDPPREHMAAAANPDTSQSLALALSEELIERPRTAHPRRRLRPEPATAKPATAPTPHARAARPEKKSPSGHARILLPPPHKMRPVDGPSVVIEMAGPRQVSTALSAVAPPPPPVVPDGRRGDLLRHMRRTWMGPAFNTTPHSLMVLTVRSALGTDAADFSHPAAAAVLTALRELGQLFETGPNTAGVLLRGVTLHQSLRIGDALCSAVDRQTHGGESQPVLLSAGTAALYRDDDPVSVMLLAERCLAAAAARDASAVVGENAPNIRHMRLK